jgi:hypothetical protein
MILLFLLLKPIERVRHFCEGIKEPVEFKDAVNLDIVK